MSSVPNMKKMANKDILSDPDTYVTERGILTVNLETLAVHVHDGHTHGGIPIGGSGGDLGQLANVSPSVDNLNNTTDVGKVLMWDGSLWVPVALNVAPSTILVGTIPQRNALTPAFGSQVYVSNSDDGNGNNINMWSLWIWLPAGWVLISNQQSVVSDSSTLAVDVSALSGGNVTVGQLSSGGRITLVTVEVIAAFDGSPTLNIGYTVDGHPAVPNGIMTAANIDLTVAGSYTATSDIVFGTDTPTGDIVIAGTFVNGGATMGLAQIIVSYV